MAQDPLYKICLRNLIFEDHICEPDPIMGKLIEWEHAMYYAGKQIQERWAIIPICWYVHRGGELDKEKNRFLALNRASDEDLEKYPRANFKQQREYLNNSYPQFVFGKGLNK